MNRHGTAGPSAGRNSSTRAAEELADAFEGFCPNADRLIVPNGYRDIGFALVDAVFSMQARYEDARRAVANYARHVGTPTAPLPVDADTPDQHGLDDLLDALVGLQPGRAADEVFDNRAKSPRANQLKAALVIEAARQLTAPGVELHTRHDVARLPTDPAYRAQKESWTSVRGLGPVTFEYFRMLCGAETSKPDVMVLGWLDTVLGHRHTWQEGLELVAALTDELGRRWDRSVPQRAIDHTIWRHQSQRGLDPNAPVGWNADV